jgi:hypothetical protein
VDKIENDDYAAQLRALRFLLGKNFRPISTTALAALTGIDVVSIRGVEAGRRKLNEQDQRNIMLRLGAFWNPRSLQWEITWGPETPYSRLHYEIYSNRLINSATLVAENKARVLNDLDILLQGLLQPGLEAKEAVFALMKIHHELCQIAKQNNVSEGLINAIQRPLPILQSLSARDKAIEARDKELENLGPRHKTRTPAGKKRKAKP